MCSFYTTTEVDNINTIIHKFSTEGCEPNEVTDIKLMEVGLLLNNPDYTAKEFAFGHDEMIKEIFMKKINIPDWKKWWIKKVEKWTKINIKIS